MGIWKPDWEGGLDKSDNFGNFCMIFNQTCQGKPPLFGGKVKHTKLMSHMEKNLFYYLLPQRKTCASNLTIFYFGI